MASTIRVLIADDEVEYTESLARVLRRRGLHVDVVGDGMAALQTLSGAEFDVVVLDLRMPGLDGLTTLQQIRSRDQLTPVLLLSGNADLERVSTALASGAADFLLKPCEVETLVSAIEDAAERKAIAREMATKTGSSSPGGSRR
jgi:two-component system, OmpR family, response regulator